MKAKAGDWISLIEAGYSLDGDDRQWFDHVFECAKPLFNFGEGQDGWLYSVTPTTFELGIGRWPLITRTMAKLLLKSVSPVTMDFLYRSGIVAGTHSEWSHLAPDQFALARKIIRVVSRGIEDGWMARCSSGTGMGIGFGTCLKKCRDSTPSERKRWPQIAAHLGAGLRLRKLARDLSLDAPVVEAILDSSGKLQDARSRAAESIARENLRRAALSIDRSRSLAARAEPDEAMDRWEGLIDGRWSLVDRFDTDGKRFIVAIKNDPVHPDPRGLTAGERQIAEFIGMGRPNKEIRYILGVSDAAVSNGVARVQDKLGLNSRSEIASFFAQNGLRRKLAEIAVSDESLLVGAYPLIDAEKVSRLTPAEREITALIVAGSTNSDIARRRGSSEHTVANQVAAIFTKLQARSRVELAAQLQARDR